MSVEPMSDNRGTMRESLIPIPLDEDIDCTDHLLADDPGGIQSPHPAIAVPVAGVSEEQNPIPTRHLDSDVLRLFRELSPGSHLLDIGVPNGEFLRAARAAGFEVEGIAFNREQALLAQRASGVPVHFSPLTRLPALGRKYHAANLDHALAGHSDPEALLAIASQLIVPNGILRVRERICTSLSAGLDLWKARKVAGTTPCISHATLVNWAQAAGLLLLRWHAGTEASLGSWRRHLARSGGSQLLGPVTFGLRKVRLGTVSLWADRSYYFRKVSGS